MKSYILPSIRLTVVCALFFTVVYPLVVYSIAQLSPGKGEGEIVYAGSSKNYVNIGQSFKADKYFNSRPSAVDYNAAGSGGSNKGPSNPEYLQLVKDRIDSFLVHNPGISKEQIPADLITASGSGLDPHISLQAAKVQVKRIAAIRSLKESDLLNLLEEQKESPLLGWIGPEKINVLRLNLALDQIK